MLTYRHSELISNSCALRNKKEKKIAPWYLEMPHDFLRFCVAILHRKCVLYFHWSRISGWKWQWILSEWDVKALDYFLPSIDGSRRSVFLRKMGGESRLAIHRDLKKEFPGALTEATAGTWATTLRAGHMPRWWPSLVLFLLLSLGQGHSCQRFRDAWLYPHRHTQDVGLAGKWEAGRGGKRNTDSKKKIDGVDPQDQGQGRWPSGSLVPALLLLLLSSSH